MKLKMLKEYIQKECKKYIIENTLYKILKEDSSEFPEGNETQRQFVIKLAEKNPLGLISLSDVAIALNTTNDAVRDNYARNIRYFKNRSDFVKIINEVPFQSAAVYQLTVRHNEKPLSREEKMKIKREQEIKFKQATGIYYSIYCYTKHDMNPITIGFLNLTDDDKIDDYKKLLPKEQMIYGDLYHYAMGTKKMYSVPEKYENKVVTKEDFQKFIDKEFEEDN